MAAPNQYHVDPAAGSDSVGDGSIGKPWKTIQHALGSISRNAADGDQINVKAGAADLLSASLDLTTYGTPSPAAPLIFRGYSAAANDGGVGEIGGKGGGFPILNNATASGIYFIDLKLRDTGNAAILMLPNSSGVLRCELYGSTVGGVSTVGNSPAVILAGCHVHDIAGYGFAGTGMAYMNFFKNGPTNKFTDAIRLGSSSWAGLALFNVIQLDGASSGISFIRANLWAIGNTIYGGGSSGKGINLSSAGALNALYLNNYVEGFSQSGGAGFYAAAGAHVAIRGGNCCYDCGTSASPDVILDLGPATALGASALANVAGGDFSVSRAIQALGAFGAFPGTNTNQYLDVGAAQRQESGKGAGGFRGLYTGGRL